MAVTVDWSSYTIHVTKGSMVQIQALPTEIWQLDIPTFKETLGALLDEPEAITYPDIFIHYPSVTVGGAVLAKVVEILEPYTITFEDGQYAVNLVGANSNIGDRVNVNQVSVRSANSAGLQDLTSLQAASYGGGVAVDQVNGVPGTTFPIGTRGTPVNNYTDAVYIASHQNLDVLYAMGPTVLGNGDNVDGYIIVGQNPTKTHITIGDLASTLGTEFRECSVTGILDGGSVIRSCLVYDINYMNGFLVDSVLGQGVITLGGNASAMFLRCVSGVAGSSTPIIDMGDSGQSLGIRDYSGGLTIINRSGNDPISVDMSSGQIIFDETITNTDNIYVRGIARITDNSTGSSRIDSVGLLSGERTVRGAGYVTVDSSGVSGTDTRTGTESFPSNNIADAIAIAKIHSVNVIHVHDEITTDGTEDLTDFTLIGESPVVSSLIITEGTKTTNTTFREINLNGVLSSDGVIIERCQIGTISGVQNYIYQSFIYGTVGLSGNTAAAFCAIAPNAALQRATFDFMGMASTLIISDWGAGVAIFDNMITGSFGGASGTGGRIELGASNTGGKVVYGGSLLMNEINLDTVDVITDSSVAGAVIDKSVTHPIVSDIYSVSGTVVTSIDDFKADVSNLSADVNIVEVAGVPVTSIDEFKADVSNLDVDLSTIPEAVWTYLSRTLTEGAGLTPEQEAKVDAILLEVQNIDCSGTGTTGGSEWVVTI